MTIESALYTLLSSYSALAALVGTRIYMNTAPQEAALPLITYQVISNERDYHHGGQASMAGPYVQFTIQAQTYQSARAVCAAVRARLSGYKGTVSTVVIDGCFLENEFDGYNLDTPTHTVRQDYRIRWQEI